MALNAFKKVIFNDFCHFQLVLVVGKVFKESCITFSELLINIYYKHIIQHKLKIV